MRLIVPLAMLLGVLSFGCKARQEPAGAEVLGSEPLSVGPPKTVYHFGVYQYLQPYQQRSSGFSQAEWQAIPSVGQAPWGSSRAGFYVSQHPAYNERYSADGLSSPRSGSPWMMTVTIKDECLENERWIDFTARRVLSYCDAGSFSPKGYQVPANCNNEATNYLRTNGIGLVRDAWWPRKGFWYIFDRGCIEALDGTADGFLRAAATVNEFWKMAPFENDERRDTEAEANYKPGEVTFAILVRALTESSLEDQQLLAKVAENAKATDIDAIKGPLIALTEYAKACVASGNAASLKQQLQFFVSKIDQQSLAKEGLSFNQHINNLVRYGLPKLTAACRPDSSVAAAVGSSAASTPVSRKKAEPPPRSSRCRGYSGDCRNSDEYTFRYRWNHIGEMGGESFQTMRSNSSNYNPSFYRDTTYTVCGYFEVYQGRKTLFLCGEL